MEQLTYTKKDGSDYVLFTLSGDFNAYTAQSIQNEIFTTIEKSNVVLDLANVNVLDSSAVGLIMAAHNDAEENKKKLYLLSLSNEVDRKLLATGFKELFNIITSVTEVK
ncbi:MAG: STAS domain-containing protein [Treponema sp.]|nr:STAS domain-containing protein [Treponema sp.]